MSNSNNNSQQEVIPETEMIEAGVELSEGSNSSSDDEEEDEVKIFNSEFNPIHTEFRPDMVIFEEEEMYMKENDHFIQASRALRNTYDQVKDIEENQLRQVEFTSSQYQNYDKLRIQLKRQYLSLSALIDVLRKKWWSALEGVPLHPVGTEIPKSISADPQLLHKPHVLEKFSYSDVMEFKTVYLKQHRIQLRELIG
jgi:hypothetical protein